MGKEKKELYLTFDDGPVPGPTDIVLDQLRQSSVEATFFCIGDNIRKYPSIFKRIELQGHTIGNHTFNHLNGWRTSTGQYLANAKAFEEIVGEDHATNLFRPPYGRITLEQIKCMRNYRIIMWDVLTRDYDSDLSPDRCLRGALAACRPGSIIVFHDSYKAEKNMKYVLPRLIEFGKEKGYTFRKL